MGDRELLQRHTALALVAMHVTHLHDRRVIPRIGSQNAVEDVARFFMASQVAQRGRRFKRGPGVGRIRVPRRVEMENGLLVVAAPPGDTAELDEIRWLSWRDGGGAPKDVFRLVQPKLFEPDHAEPDQREGIFRMGQKDPPEAQLRRTSVPEVAQRIRNFQCWPDGIVTCRCGCLECGQRPRAITTPSRDVP